MTPLDFVKEIADSYNIPVGDIAEALNRPLRIRSIRKEWVILSYYYDNAAKEMVIVIQKDKK